LPTSTRTPLSRSPLPSATASPAAGATGCEETKGRLVEEQYASRLRNTQQHYLVYLPPCDERSDRRYPTIYLLHGSQNDETHWERLGLFQEVEQGLQKAGWLRHHRCQADLNLYVNTSGGPNSLKGNWWMNWFPSLIGCSRPTAPNALIGASAGAGCGHERSVSAIPNCSASSAGTVRALTSTRPHRNMTRSFWQTRRASRLYASGLTQAIGITASLAHRPFTWRSITRAWRTSITSGRACTTTRCGPDT
jgi:hypothetical protein